jgi:DNA-binding MarR family transcriptional regulator
LLLDLSPLQTWNLFDIEGFTDDTRRCGTRRVAKPRRGSLRIRRMYRGNAVPASQEPHIAEPRAYLERLQDEGLVNSDLLRIYVAGVIFGRAADRIFDARYLRELGISNREFEALISIFIWGRKYQNQGVLADHLGMSPAGVSALVDRLEGRGLVTRALEPTDARARLVVLTADGFALADAGLRIQLEWINETIGSALTAAQAGMLEELLVQVLQVVNPSYAPPPVGG